MKKFLTVLLVIIIMAAIVTGCFFAYKYFTKEETPVIEDTSKVDTKNQLFTVENYPVVDGSTATIPLSEAFKINFTGDKNATVDHATTHYAYLNLINGDADLILVTEPSEEELAIAKEKGVELEVIKVVNEAFTFYVNVENPVSNLTLEQIQKIYSGEITNWSEVGGNDAQILAYQREKNSGSQTGMLSLVMKDVKLMTPKQEDIIKDMSSIVNLVSDYDNGKDSIGYSYYYYATTMYDDIDSSVTDRIKFLAVNGVEPNSTTIKNGTYPIMTAYYIVINKAEPEGSPTRQLVDAMLSERGQAVAQEARYVPIK